MTPIEELRAVQDEADVLLAHQRQEAQRAKPWMTVIRFAGPFVWASAFLEFVNLFVPLPRVVMNVIYGVLIFAIVIVLAATTYLVAFTEAVRITSTDRRLYKLLHRASVLLRQIDDL